MRVDDDLQSLVEKFYREITEAETQVGKSSQKYILIRQTSQDYIFNLNGGTDLLRKIIVDESIKGWIINKSLDVFNTIPSLVKIVPNMGEFVFQLPQNRIPELIVCKGSKVILVEPRSGYVIKIPDNHEEVVEWVQARESLPSSVNAPKIVTYNRDYSYLVEEYISGEYSKLKLKNWRRVNEALRNLRPLYKSERESIEINEIIKNTAQNPTLRYPVKILRQLDLPSEIYKSRIHGDLHPGNTLVNNGELYILDWEKKNHGYIIRDMFHWILSISKYNNHKEIFSKMINLNGGPGEIFKVMSHTVGDLAYGQKKIYTGLPLLYLVLRCHLKLGDQNYNNSLLQETISLL